MELQRLCKQVPLYFRGTYLIIKGRGQCRFGSVIGVPNHTILVSRQLVIGFIRFSAIDFPAKTYENYSLLLIFRPIAMPKKAVA